MIWLHLIQYAGFFSAQVTNSVLVYLIMTKAEKLFGSYRHVMCTFAMYSLIYAWIEVLTQPVMHIKGPIFIVYMDSPMKYYTPEILSRIEGYKLVLIFIPCLICFVFWFEFVYWGMANTIEKQEYMKEELKFYYDEDSTKVSFIAPMYWSIGPNGEKIWKFWECMSSVGCIVIIVICFSTILYCAYNIYRSMKSTQCHMSAKTLELNRQLFITLTFQTILPFCMMYSPVGLLIALPVFEVYVGKIANYVGASLAVYPSLEPIIAIICIKEFRRTVLCYRRRKIQATTTQSNVSSSYRI
ncbi:hypothetical protein CAEBREN_18938 [Caenorhabditis brenneri]|uniref:Serpentine receptor class r-10 n=1 Tax=Caenorhabditis brenneri TaxID=135651 RepID=G0N2X5_CAEBE|nr:hypothetical protein CAEBREN_18938 [Caenorhabditis brenneri]